MYLSDFFLALQQVWPTILVLKDQMFPQNVLLCYRLTTRNYLRMQWKQIKNVLACLSPHD
jgi:hypothetical protein